MNKPTNITELVGYLAEKGHVDVVDRYGKVCDSRLFLRYEDATQRLYFFSRMQNREAFSPVSFYCTPGGGVSFREEGFCVHCFHKGVDYGIRYRYVG